MDKVNDELVTEFMNRYIEDLNPEIYPKQFAYKYKLFLLEKGYYGIERSDEQDSTVVSGCSSEPDKQEQDGSDGVSS